MFKVNVVTLFPEMFPGPLGHSIVGRALTEEKWHLATTNIRDFGQGKRRTVDDTPYGGGAGMVLRPDVVAQAIRQAKADTPGPVVYLTPTGRRLTQTKTEQLATQPGMILLCGHYEGIDERVIDAEVDEQVSIGDYVLSGGEIPAMVLLDAVVRHLPGALGGETSLAEESFSLQDDQGVLLLEYPHYTRPDVWEERAVPAVLTSGHHADIERWRQEQAKNRTQKRKKELSI